MDLGRWVRAAAVAGLCLLGACSSGGDRGTGVPEPTKLEPKLVPFTEPPATVAASTAATTTIPVITTLADAQILLDDFAKREGDLIRKAYTAKRLTPEVEAGVREIYGEPFEDSIVDAFRIDEEDGFATYLDPPGAPWFRALEFIEQRRGCVHLLIDLSATDVIRPEAEPEQGRYKTVLQYGRGVPGWEIAGYIAEGETKLKNLCDWAPRL